MSRHGTVDRTFAFLITAAGSGTRMGGGEKKEFRTINGKPVLLLTLENFINTGLFSFGTVTCKPGTQDEVKKLLAPLFTGNNCRGCSVIFCDGGAERQQSVYLGLQFLSANFPGKLDNSSVLIHDGARPWADGALISRVVQGCRSHQACAPIIPSIDAMKEVNADGIITGHLPRKETVQVQTPQGFAFNEILAAHSRAAADGRHYIDDTEIFSRYEGDVYTVEGSTSNRKITYASDLEI